MKNPVVKLTTMILLTAVLAAALIQPVVADEGTEVVYSSSNQKNQSSGTSQSSSSSISVKEFVEWGATRGRSSDLSKSEDGASSLEVSHAAATNASVSAASTSASSSTAETDPVAAASTTKTKSTSTTTTSFAFEPSTKHKYESIQKKILEHQKTNPEIKGWLIVPGTNINEPIPFNNTSNDYYLNRTWQGKDYPGNNWTNFVITATYADRYTKFGDSWKSSSKNNVLYGHNWTNLRTPLAVGSNNNHTMFGQLPSYTDIKFASSNPYIYYSTDKIEGVWKVFAVAYCEDNKNAFPYNMADPSKETYTTIINEWKSRSLFNFGVDVNVNDRILTLSTCTRMYANAGENQRYVVVARLLREGESEKDKVTVSVNPSVKQPQF